MAESWDPVARAYDHVSRGSRAHRDKIERVAQLVAAGGARDVLDIGCGSGVLEARLYGDGFRGRVTAIDSSAAMVAMVREACADRPVVVQRRDLNAPLPYADDAFDCAVAMNVLFLLDDAAATVSEVRRVLRAGASFFVVMPKPEAGSVWAFVREHFRRLGVGEALRETLRLIAGLPAIIVTARFQTKLDAEHERTGKRYLTQEQTEELLRGAGFVVQRVSDIQAGQNWLFECVTTSGSSRTGEHGDNARNAV